MLNKKQKENIAAFFEAIDKISHQGLYDLGLIVKTPKLKISDLIKLIPKSKKAEILGFNIKSTADDLIKFILKAFKEKKWGFIGLEDGFLPASAYSQLRLLSTNNRLQIFDKEKELNLKQPKESRIIIIGDEKVLSQIKIPTFLRLFGPIINLK
jgi:hypothetical protein